MQKYALEMAMVYDLLFRNAPEPGILPVMRGRSRSEETTKKVAKDLSPLFTHVILDQIDLLTTRKLGEILGVENIMDAKIVKDEFIRLKSTLC